MAEMKEVEVTPETNKQVEEVFAALYQQPLSELRLLYQREFNVALKGKDKQRIAMRLAKKLVAKGQSAPSAPPSSTKPGKSNGKSNGVSTKPAPKKGSGGLTEEEATEVLIKARSAFVKVDALKAEKREEVRGIKEKIDESKDKITEILRDDGDAEVRVEKLEATWSRFNKLEGKKAKVVKEFNDKIKDASQALRDTLTNLRQGSLPFGEDNDE